LQELDYLRRSEDRTHKKLEQAVHQIHSLEREIDDLTAQIRVQQDKEVQFEQEIQDLRANNSKTRKKHDEMERVVLHSKLNREDDQILQGMDVEALKNQIFKLQLQNEDLSSYVDVLEWRNKAAEGEKENISKLKEARQEIARKSSRIGWLEADVQTLKEELKSKDNKLELLQEVKQPIMQDSKETERRGRAPVENV
jgi:chromosome segregation ATPase